MTQWNYTNYILNYHELYKDILQPSSLNQSPLADLSRLLDAIASVPEEILGEMAQLTKENSIEGCKA